MPSFLTVALGGRGDRPLDLFAFALPRLAAIGAALLVAAMLQHRPGGDEIAPAVTAVTLAGVSVLASWALPLGIVSVLVAAALALPLGRWFPGPIGETLRQLVLQLNRQLGHVESLFSWVVLALLFSRLTVQVATVGALVGFGPLLVDYLGWRRLRRARASTAGALRAADPSRADLSEERRPVFYVATLLAQLLFFALAPRQFLRVAPLVAAVMIGIAARWYAFRRFRAPEDVGRIRAAENGRRLDRAVLIAALGAGAIVSVGAGLAGASGAGDRARRACLWTSCAEPPSQAEVALFLVADTQLHALDGAPSGFQVGLVDSVVPVALRPVELDMLSGATLRHFATLFRRAKVELPALRWAHLGDVADVGCQSEIEAFEEHAARFGEPPVAVAPGNHDLTFLGNVFWHPEWSPACRRHRAERSWTLARLRSLPGAAGAQAGSLDEAFDASVVTLGTVAGHEVLGVFLDSTDYGVPDLGIAGAQGSISSAQARWVLARLEGHPSANVVLFVHHPVDELSWRGKRAVSRLRDALGERLLLIVSAHTHVAAWRGSAAASPDPARRWVAPEFVVGSTLDPPQEAAILRVGHARGRAWANVRTIAAVQRTGAAADVGAAARRPDGLVCARAPGAVAAASCERIAGALATRPACAGLFAADGARFRAALRREAPCSTCLELPLGDGDEAAPSVPPGAPEQACELGSRLARATDRALFRWLGYRDVQLHCSRQRRAWELLRCLEGDVAGERTPALPLDRSDLSRRIADLYPSGGTLDAAALERRDTLVCLGWAASILQARKRDGWSLARALELGFDAGATYGELSATSSPPDGSSGPVACAR